MSNNETQPSVESLKTEGFFFLVDLTREACSNKCSPCKGEFNVWDNLKEHPSVCCKENGENASSSIASRCQGIDYLKQSTHDTTNDTNNDINNKPLNNKYRTISSMESAESSDESDNSEFFTSPNGSKKRKREEEEASDISRAYKLRKKSMSMKEGLFSLLNQTHPDVDFNGDSIISWLQDGKSFVIHNWDKFAHTLNRICGQTFKALASNLSKFGFVRQKNKEQNVLQRHYLCPSGFERGGSNEELKNITSNINLGGSPYCNFDSQVPAYGAFNPILLSNPFLYKVHATLPPMIHKAAIVAEANGYPQKDLPMVSQTLPVKEPVLHDNPLVPAYNSTLPTYCGQSGAPGLTNNFNNPNNVLQSSRDELSWPKLLSFENKPMRIFTGPFEKRDETFRINIYTLLTKKSTPACPEVPFSPLIQENCGDLYFTRLRGVPPDGLDWPTTPHTRVIYRTQTGRLQVGGSNQALQDGNVAVMRRHVWKSLCNQFKRHEYVLIDGQQKNKYWNVKEDSPVLYCYFRVTDEEGNAPTLPNHVLKDERVMSPRMNGHEPDVNHFRVDNSPVTANAYRVHTLVQNTIPYKAKMTDLDSIAEASVKMATAPLPSSPVPRHIEAPPNGVTPLINGYSHHTSAASITTPSSQSNPFPQSSVPKTYTLPFPWSKDPLPINGQMNGGNANGVMLGTSEVSNLLAMIEHLKQQIKAMEVIKENQRITYEKQVFDLTLENQNLQKQLDLVNSKINQVRETFNIPMVDGLVSPRGFNPAILAVLQQTANMANNSGIGATSSPDQLRSQKQNN